MSYKKMAIGTLFATGLMAGAQATEQTSAEVSEAQLNEFRAAMQQFAQSLQGELQTAMKSGGPVEAIEVCHIRAPEIATDVGADTGIALHRTSLKPRQRPALEWEQAILHWFETRQDEGADLKTLEWYGVSQQDGKETLHYMKPIPTAQVCLNCHGTDINQAVISKLNRLYPDDQARGYQEGDIRGAFVLQAPLD